MELPNLFGPEVPTPIFRINGLRMIALDEDVSAIKVFVYAQVFCAMSN